MENHLHVFRETNLLLQFMQELGIKNENVMSWSSQ